MVKLAGLRSEGLELEPLSVVELTPVGVDSACHPSEVSDMSNSVLVIEGTASAAQPHAQEMMQSEAAMPGVALMARVVGLRSQDPEFKSPIGC